MEGEWTSAIGKEPMMFKRGDNVKFICTYLFNNPGASFTQVREALCVFRGHDPKKRRGQYTWYFCYDDARWVKRDRRYFVTDRGLAWVSKN
jgi:hypothetical protein